MERVEMVSISLYTQYYLYVTHFQEQIFLTFFLTFTLTQFLIGYDYWARVYGYNQDSWPQKREIDKRDLFLPPTESEDGSMSSNSLKVEDVTTEQRSLLEGG